MASGHHGSSTSGPASSSSAGSAGSRSRSAEFKKRLNLFENVGDGSSEEGLFEPPLDQQTVRARK